MTTRRQFHEPPAETPSEKARERVRLAAILLIGLAALAAPWIVPALAEAIALHAPDFLTRLLEGSPVTDATVTLSVALILSLVLVWRSRR